MFRDEKGLEVEYREKMRGGDGTVAIRHLFPKDELGPHCRMMARITLPPGASIGPHDHTGERELYHIIRGKACLEENGKTYTMVPGDSSITGGGGVHALRNIGDEPLELLAVIVLD
ncbi:MAG TPA: cupin domain-containing protein [Firmicutes bacterium]|mgnify:CR=1 FL=1|jgi:quercetin dioxygenase-like cupin family protein|nr:cupin domain-containing protein [Bacillota bacterium]HOQ23091.1 cupin domain-containing protein [Bacillota bacterium]HPT66988.1 cupin domain-containing protein [Bacillota bacterium]